MQSVGELLIDFFRFYCHSFAFNTDVVSIRLGLLTKESKQWTTDTDVGGLNDMSRDRNRLCIEDPFDTSYVRPLVPVPSPRPSPLERAADPSPSPPGPLTRRT